MLYEKNTPLILFGELHELVAEIDFQLADSNRG